MFVKPASLQFEPLYWMLGLSDLYYFGILDRKLIKRFAFSNQRGFMAFQSLMANIFG